MELVFLLLVVGVIAYLWFKSRGGEGPDFQRNRTRTVRGTSRPAGKTIARYDEETGEPVWKSVPELVDETPIVQESLPLPFVHYPHQYSGVYLGFSKVPDSKIYLCKCAEFPLRTYSRYGSQLEWDYSSRKTVATQKAEKVEALRRVFPGPLAERVAEGLRQGQEPVDVLSFRPNLCHKCNASVPIPEHGGTQNRTRFRKKFGWYLRQKKHQFGVGGLGISFLFYPDHGLPDARPEQLNRFIEEAPDSPEPDTDVARRTRNWIENQAREEFDIRAVGEAWLSETILHRIIDQLFPETKVRHRAYPDWLNGQELDVYVPQLDLAFEYQGRQHYEPVEYFGGEERFEEVKKRDERKKERCEQAGVVLVEIPYSVELSPAAVATHLINQQPHLSGKMRSAEEVQSSDTYQKEIEELRSRLAPEG